MKKILIVSLLLLFLIPALPALADGMVMWPDPYSDRWDFVGENNQQAFINYQDSIERMILSIELEKTPDNAVWIFPVPAEPNAVAVDIITNLPRFRGEEIGEKAESILDYKVRDFLFSSQVYTLPYILIKKVMTGVTGATGGLGSAGLGGPSIERKTKPDVVVHKELKKEGMTTQVITARTSQGLYDYLKNKNLNIEKGSIPALDHYIGKDFSFIITWVTSPRYLEQAQSKQKGVFVTFPSERIYYPLILTSVYGEKVIPTTLRILGYYNPTIPKNLKQYVNTDYFIKEKYYYTDLDYIAEKDKKEKLWGGMEIYMYGSRAISSWEESPISKMFYGVTENNQATKGKIKYTKIEFNAPSKLFNQDLSINTDQPLPYKASLALFIISMSNFYGLRIFFLIILSLLAGPIAGWLVLRKNWAKQDFYTFFVLGLSNCLSLIGLIMSSFFVNKLKPVKPQLTENENPEKKLHSRRITLVGLIKAFFAVIGLLFIVYLIFDSLYLFHDIMFYIIITPILLVSFFIARSKHKIAQTKNINHLILNLLMAFFMIIGVLCSAYFVLGIFVLVLGGSSTFYAVPLVVLTIIFIMTKSKRVKFVSAYSGIFLVLTFLSIMAAQMVL